MRSLLEESVYKKVKKDFTKSVERRVTSEILKLQKQKLIPKALADSLKPKASNIPKFDGLHKIHKSDVPLQPIASSIGGNDETRNGTQERNKEWNEKFLLEHSAHARAW